MQYSKSEQIFLRLYKWPLMITHFNMNSYCHSDFFYYIDLFCSIFFFIVFSYTSFNFLLPDLIDEVENEKASMTRVIKWRQLQSIYIFSSFFSFFLLYFNRCRLRRTFKLIQVVMMNIKCLTTVTISHSSYTIRELTDVMYF
jgi:hypothetical protein